MKDSNNHFEHWIETTSDKNVLLDDFDAGYSNQNELIDNGINSMNGLIENFNNWYKNSSNIADATCSDAKNWFDQSLKDQIKRTPKITRITAKPIVMHAG